MKLQELIDGLTKLSKTCGKDTEVRISLGDRAGLYPIVEAYGLDDEYYDDDKEDYCDIKYIVLETEDEDDDD